MKSADWHQLQGWTELKAFVSRRPAHWTRGALALTGPSGIGIFSDGKEEHFLLGFENVEE